MRRIKCVLAATVLLAVLSVSACSDGGSVSSWPSENGSNIVTSESQKPKEETNVEIKAKAIEADFVEINAGNWENKAVYATGKASSLFSSDGIFYDFLLTVESDSGYVVYNISSNTILVPGLVNLKDGDTVTVYGVVYDKKTGIPNISASIIE